MARIAAEAEAIGKGFAQQLQLQPCLQQVLQPAALPGLQRDAMRMALSAAVALPLSRAVLGLALQTPYLWRPQAANLASWRLGALLGAAVLALAWLLYGYGGAL